LDVLRGGRNALRKAKLVLLECTIIEYNEGAPNIHQYFRFTHECGFTPIEFLERIWRKGQMIQVDILFVDIRPNQALAP
jgi:hypothetical protein